MTKSYFAEATIGDRSTMREYTAEEYNSGDVYEDRGGGGDELEYDSLADTFSYAMGSGCSPWKTVPNPLPGGDLLEAAKLVAAQADREWDEPSSEPSAYELYEQTGDERLRSVM